MKVKTEVQKKLVLGEKVCEPISDENSLPSNECYDFNPLYMVKEERLDSLRCRCSCAPSTTVAHYVSASFYSGNT